MCELAKRITVPVSMDLCVSEVTETERLRAELFV